MLKLCVWAFKNLKLRTLAKDLKEDGVCLFSEFGCGIVILNPGMRHRRATRREILEEIIPMPHCLALRMMAERLKKKLELTN